MSALSLDLGVSFVAVTLDRVGSISVLVVFEVVLLVGLLDCADIE